MHHTLLVTAGSEDHSRETNAGNLSHHTGCVYRRPCAMVNLRPSFDELAAHTRQCGDTRVFRRYLNSESALQLIAVSPGCRPIWSEVTGSLLAFLAARVDFEPFFLTRWFREIQMFDNSSLSEVPSHRSRGPHDSHVPGCLLRSSLFLTLPLATPAEPANRPSLSHPAA